MKGESPLHTDVLILCRITWAFCVTPEDRLVPDQALCGKMSNLLPVLPVAVPMRLVVVCPLRSPVFNRKET